MGIAGYELAAAILIFMLILKRNTRPSKTALKKVG
jgi:hypothetical protein